MLVVCSVTYCVILIGITIAFQDFALDLLIYLTYVAAACSCLPLPTTPMVMEYASRYDPMLVAILGGFAYCIATLIDYSLVTLALRSEKISKITTTRTYCFLERIFQKYSFISLTMDTFSVVPFEPVKLIACASRYNRVKYVIACFIGRTSRYYLLGVLQRDFLHIKSEYLYGSIIVLVAIEVIRRLIMGIRRARR